MTVGTAPELTAETVSGPAQERSGEVARGRVPVEAEAPVIVPIGGGDEESSSANLPFDATPA